MFDRGQCMGPDTSAIVQAFTVGMPQDRQAVLAALPATMTRDVALQLAGSDEPSIAVVALDQVTADHVGSHDSETSLTHRSHLTDLLIARIEAHLELSRHEAAAALFAAVPEDLRAQDVRFASLRLRLEPQTQRD